MTPCIYGAEFVDEIRDQLKMSAREVEITSSILRYLTSLYIADPVNCDTLPGRC